jgi:broad specificity phosphatase PhoE
VTALYVLRHPQTTWNVLERYQGRLDTTWSELGRRQASLAKLSFQGMNIDAVYSSPLKRSLCLAELISEITNSECITENRLTEIGQTPWEGLHISEIEDRHGELYRQWCTRPDTVTFADGEGIGDVQTRALSAIRDIKSRHQGGQVVLVTHCEVVRVVVAAALCLDLRHAHRVHVSNARISTFWGEDAGPGDLLAFNSDLPYRAESNYVLQTRDCVTSGATA